MTQPALWETIRDTLRRVAVAKGYTTLPHLGDAHSQTYEFRKAGKPKAIVAFRDVGKKATYARPNRLWVEGLELVLDRYMNLNLSEPRLPPAFAVVSDNLRGHFVVAAIKDVLLRYHSRLQKPHAEGSRVFTLTIEVRASSSFLVMPEDEPNRPLPDVDTFAPILRVL